MAKYHDLKPEKQKALLLLTRQIVDPDAVPMTYEQIAQECGVSDKTLFNWRTGDANFRAARAELVDSYADEIVSDAFSALRYQVKRKRSVKASEIILKSRGMLIDRKEGGPDTVVNVDVTDKDNDTLTQEIADLRARLGRDNDVE